MDGTGERINERDTHRYRILLESVYKFRLFFAGLVFAILSFAMQFPAKHANPWIVSLEAISWFLIAATGLLALKDCGGLTGMITEKTVEGISPRLRVTMWALFISGVGVLLISKILVAFSAQS